MQLKLDLKGHWKPLTRIGVQKAGRKSSKHRLLVNAQALAQFVIRQSHWPKKVGQLIRITTSKHSL